MLSSIEGSCCGPPGYHGFELGIYRRWIVHRVHDGFGKKFAELSISRRGEIPPPWSAPANR
jgi:hypothetical protein